VLVLTGTEPAAKIALDPPLAQPLASNHQVVDKGTVTFDVPKKAATGAPSERRR
jgi:hypothetical protein